MNKTKPERGWYSLIQFCPDPSRAEAANVGVLVFCPARGFLRAVTTPSNNRVRRFFGPDDLPIKLKRINAAKDSFVRRVEMERSRITSLGDLQTFIDTRAHNLQLTDPRELRVEDPEETLRQLLTELVGGRRVRPAREHHPLFETFSRLRESRSSIEFDKPIELPQLGVSFKADFAYRNGALNLVRLLDIPERKPRHAIHEAFKLAGEGEFMAKHAPEIGGTHLLVVAWPSGSRDTRELELGLEKVFEAPSLEFIPSAGVDEFAARVESEAK